MSKLRLESVSFYYPIPGNRKAHSKKTGKSVEKNMVLQNVSLEIEAGKLVTLLGPSGCGKSTVLRLIAGYEKPTEGSIWIGNKECKAPGRNRIMVFQNFNQLYPWMNILENICFPVMISKKNTHEKTVKNSKSIITSQALALLTTMGIEYAKEFYPHQLSAGMYQKVAIARAFMQGPSVLLMDEPFASLDSESRTVLQDLLVELQSSIKQTIVFVTHDKREALRISDSILQFDLSLKTFNKEYIPEGERPRVVTDSSIDLS